MKSLLLDSARARLRFHDLPGSAVPLVFIHGLACASSCDYPRVAADPALLGRRRVLVDLLGFGFSDRPAAFGYTVEDHARTIAEFLERLGLLAADLFGHSMGGAVAIVAAGLRPDCVRRLVVSEPNLDAGGGFFSRPIAAQTEDEYVARGHERAVRAAFAQGNDVWAGTLAVSSPLAVHRGASSLVRGGSPSWRRRLETLAIPRTFVVGALSRPDPDVERLASVGVSVRVVPIAGHSMAWENPSGLAEALAAALP